MMKRIVPVFLLLVAAGCGGRLSESQEYYVGRSVSANAMFDSAGTYAGLHEDKALEEYVAMVGLTVAGLYRLRARDAFPSGRNG